MNKETAIHELFMTMKVSLKNASMYNPEHPAFKKAVEEMKEKLDGVFEFMSPLEIGCSPHALLVEDKFWDEEKMYRELGRTFHFRKVKKVKVSRGLTLNELMIFMSHICLSPREIFQKGGVEHILADKKIGHIRVEELDYAQLLEGEGEEVKDVWAYLLQEAVEEQDNAKMMEVADSFEKVIEDFEPGEFLEDKEFSENFLRFFSYLKKNEEANYRKCAKNLVKSVVKKKEEIKDEEKLESIKALITDLREEDLASTLWDEIITDDHFDSLSFSIFSRLIEKEKHDKVASSLSNIFRADDTAPIDPDAREKIKALLSGTSGGLMSEIYRQTLSSLLKDLTFDTKFSFDHSHLRSNYRFLLVNILATEKSKEDFLTLLEQIFTEWDEITEQNDLVYIQFLHEVISVQNEDILSDSKVKKSLSKLIGFVEHSILEGESQDSFDYFITHLKESTLDVNTYLERIFTDGKISPYILKAIFKFFKEYLFYFNLNLEQSAKDTKFIERIIKNLKELDSPISLITLKNIYPLGSALIKYRTLKAMQTLTEFDPKFLAPILKSKEPALKAEALVILMRGQNEKRLAFENLFHIQSPYGIRNKRLIEHIKIVEDKNLKEAKIYLEEFSRKKGFWNKKIRNEAQRVLENWNAE
ncbi:hypothetical protein ACFLT2_07675 [Acidobacteriota bacterium]